MANTNIEWTNVTWNPTTGCTKVSKECDNCYAKDMTNRMQHMPNQQKYKQGFDVFVQHEDALLEPYNWKKPKTVFVNSMSDLFHKDITPEFLGKVFKVMNETPQHTYQILTKRHHELEKYSDQLNWTDNIWMGVSVGHVAGERRIQSLVKCGAKHKFLSVEPLIEELNDLNLEGINWVITGGESGDNKSRPIEKDWILKVKKNCEQYNVPFFFKQWGKTRNNPSLEDPTINKEHRYHAKGGCLLDGKIYLANPTIMDDTIPTINVFGGDHLVMDEFEGLNTIWELKSYLPIMEKDIYSQLKKDIKKNDLNDPILYIKNSHGKKLVIEGHTRLKACIELKKKIIPTKEVKEDFNSLDDIKLWMVKHQCQRRNLSAVEKIKLAFLSKPTIEKMAKYNLSKAGKKIQIVGAIDTNDEIAKLAGVSRTSIVRYNTVLEKAPKSIIEKLIKGEMSIGMAHSSIKLHPKMKSKPKLKNKQKAPEIKVYKSIESATENLKSGIIDGIIILKNETQIELLNNNLKTNFGVVYVN